ncbi:MAG: type II toxin-antitoxin system VapC family toxin [Bryobacterales bacterium]|nr:type II toxin-antitoxin system VapC family toxin [Bryobacterales bacterium]
MAARVGEILFLDTNILVTATDALRPGHEEAQRLLAEADSGGYHLAASGQVLREYLAVSTRPAESNGLGLRVPDAVANVNEFLRFVTLFDETEPVALQLRELVMTSGVRGNRIHDANIAATMMVHHIRVLVTQNCDDFAGFDKIEPLPLDRAVFNSRP